MALLDRVMTLIRANLNDLVDQAEDPGKMVKQLVLDMENQLMQVKTQLAIAVADQHLLARKRAEGEQAQVEFRRKAELALVRGNEVLARGAVERSLDQQRLVASFQQQEMDQAEQVTRLKSAYHRLDQKLTEARTKAELLLAQQRRARAVQRAATAQAALPSGDTQAQFTRLRDKVLAEEALGTAQTELLLAAPIDDQLAALEKEAAIERVLAEIKATTRRQLT